MIHFVPIKVECYAGYKTDEEPRSFIWNNQRFEIEEIVDRWYQASRNPVVPASEYFKVRVADGRLLIIRKDRESRAWHLVETESP
jgi:hypothetical protein